MPITSGTVLFNRYRVASLLGQGGFGAVYRAWDITLSRPCAIKENFDISLEAQRQFLREATVLANLSHPNLPRVTDHFVIEGQGQYLVMDFIEGEDLDQKVAKQGAIKSEQALDWICQVLDAMVYLHTRAQPVIHRDIKPANIKITPDGKAVLVDFGLVKIYDPHMRTTAGARAITAGFSPPEQYGQATTDARTDIYALGATLYMLLTGVPPMESVLRVGQDELMKVNQVNPSVPLNVSDCVARAMELGPNQRYPTALEFRKALISSNTGIAHEQAAAPVFVPLAVAPTSHLAAVPAAVPGVIPKKAARRNLKPIALLGGGLLAVAVCIGGFFTLGGNSLLSGDLPKKSTPPEIITATEEPTAEVAVVNPPIMIDGMLEEAFETPLIVPNEKCGDSDIIKKIQALDEYTVQFILCKPDAGFLAKLSMESISVQPKEWIAWTKGSGELLSQPIGTGPFILDEWIKGDSIKLKQNPYYFGTPARVETAIVRWDTDSRNRFLALLDGSVDEISNLNPEDYLAASTDSNMQVLMKPRSNVFYIGFTNTFTPWDNQQVRQAIGLGIDRQKIVDTYYPLGANGAEVASHFTPCSIPHGCDGQDWYEYDPIKARDLLSKAGYPNGFSTKLYYRDGVRAFLPDPSGVGYEIKKQLRENLNIEVEVVSIESSKFLELLQNGKLDGLYFAGWSADFNHITNFLDPHFGRNNVQFGTPYPDIYELLEAAATLDEPGNLYEMINDLILELMPAVPIAHTSETYAARADLIGANAPDWGSPNLAIMQPGDGGELVFMQFFEPSSLYCMDESDTRSLLVCHQVLQGLMQYGADGTPEPALAASYEISEDRLEYTFTLRKGVLFHNGFTLDANDVVASFAAALDVSNPYHTGNTGTFEYPTALFGLMND